MQNAVAEGDTRTISLHHVHTKENLTITYERGGRYDQAALQKINHLLRDWRRNEEVATDPHLLDLVWEVQREVGAKEAIHVICGYRAPQTNAMLRRKTDGVAQFSQHTQGKALDFFIPGIPLADLRNVGLRLQRGGIGFYPGSGSPFVHLDVGSVRHWPSISREELARIFPSGRTVHVPSDGRPLAGYALALADLERRGNTPSAVSLNSARVAGVLNRSDGEKQNGNALAKLLGFGQNSNEAAHISGPATNPPARLPNGGEKVARAPAKTPAHNTAITTASTRQASSGLVVAAALPPPGAPQAAPAPKSAPVTVASADVTASLPWPTGRRERGMPEQVANAAQPGRELTRQPAARQPIPMTVSAPSGTKAAMQGTSLVPKQAPGQAVAVLASPAAAYRFDDPWLRAAILAPNLREHMTVTAMGSSDPRGLSIFMQKPSSSVTTSFSHDPQAGPAANQFSGHAVVFVATTIFNNRTALLR